MVLTRDGRKAPRGLLVPTGDSLTKNDRTFARWAALGVCLLAAILIPLALVGSQLESAVAAIARLPDAVPVSMGVAGLLAADVVLPIPSSLVSTFAGSRLGIALGALASTVGMTAGALAGYGAGRAFARPVTRRVVGSAELARAEALANRFGHWAVLVARPVPVLAEASVVLAGANGMPLPRFALLVTLSNLGISLVYACAGAYAATHSVFLVAFAAALGIPFAAILLARALPKGPRAGPNSSRSGSPSHVGRRNEF
jgi:membrane protein DedA with SNARE-associated domain